MPYNTKLGAVTMALSDCYKVVAGVPGNGARKIKTPTPAYLKFHFEKQISSSRLLILESQMKRFTDIAYVDFVQFASDVDTLISTQMI